MIQLITQGIKVSVETQYEDTFYNNHKRQYAFSYTITIENQSEYPVQLTSRYWMIKDALNATEIVEGDGVIGEQPIIDPGEKHTYNSGCLLNSPVGSMQGYYNMLTPTRKIKVGIPLFKLSAPFAQN